MTFKLRYDSVIPASSATRRFRLIAVRVLRGTHTRLSVHHNQEVDRSDRLASWTTLDELLERDCWWLRLLASQTQCICESSSQGKSMQLFSVRCREKQLLPIRSYVNCVRSLRWSARDSLLSICMQNSWLIVNYSLTINILVPPASIGRSCNNTGYFYLHLLSLNNTRESVYSPDWPVLPRENPI